MRIDELDLFIIKEIFLSDKEDRDATTWQIAKRYWKTEAEENDTFFFNKKCQIVVGRLKKMKKEGFVAIVKDESNNLKYGLIEGRVEYKKHKFPKGYSDSILILGLDDKWIIFEV